ncbi:MAG: hypothetical protein AAGC81_11095 [Pseudomonadota bacterium]
MARILFCSYGILFTGLIIALVLELSTARTGGALFYVLDDPYIHLSVAESILAGGYGVNVGEVASPSSSILYPFLLSGTLALGLGDWGGLIINATASIITAWIIASLIWRLAVEPQRFGSVLTAIICLPLVYACYHLFALPMTGMEHSLHVLASTAIIIGLAGLTREYSPSFLLIAGIFCAPLLRFEGLALAGPALLMMLFMGHVRWFLVTTTALFAAFAAYWGMMTSLGLPLFPSSVLVKSNVMEAATNESVFAAIYSVIENIRLTLRLRFGTVYGVTIALLLLVMSWQPAENRWRLLPMTFALICALIGHSIIGAYGSFSRWETYTFAICVTALIIAFGGAVRRPGGSIPLRFLGIATVLAIFSAPMAKRVFTTPDASENIYAQHYQMHRFATEFFAYPSAVNDLGWVAYRNDIHVLDLWGLGSEQARISRTADQSGVAGIDALTREAGSTYAMIYDEWFEDGLPAQWCKVATLITPKITAAEGEVAFYLIDRSKEAEMEKALAEFAASLPDVSSLETTPCQN